MSEPAATGESAADATSLPPAGPEAAGAILLKERRRQGLSLGDISRQLKLSVRQVEALERDDYSGYKGPVFIHGFIRNYAKLLGLDPNPLIRSTDSMLNPPPAPVAPVREPERLQPVRTERKKIGFWPAVVIVFVIGIAVSVYFGGRRAPDGGRSAPTVALRDKPASPPKTTADARVGADAKTRSEPKQEPEPVVKPAAKPDKKAETKPETRTEPAERRMPAETGGAVAAEPPGRMTLRMQFDQDSWVEIKDRNGNSIFGQLNPAGSRRSASGEPPLTVVIGNAAGVRLFQGDKSIDLAPHTRVDVARLTLE